jgi:DNA-3-methyladenine glycosylase II
MAVVGALSDGERFLAKRDPVMRALIKQVGPSVIGKRRNRTSFEALVRAIVFQQLAGKAAAAIYARVEALFPGGRVTPEHVLATPEDSLRGAGLSAAKAASIRDFAAKCLDGIVPLRSLGRLGDEEIIQRLITVRGIGRWTSEMFLLFQLGRPDVWPVEDLGVRNGYRIAYELPAMPTSKELGPLGDRFRPFRSYAAWYCWQAVHIARGQMVTPGR